MNAHAIPRKRLVVVGGGMAGLRAIEEILLRAPDRFAITVFGAEPFTNYNRILLSAVLAGEKDFHEIVLHDHAWYRDNGIELIAGETVVDVDRTSRQVFGANGTVRPYDSLLIATGSNSIVLPVPGATLPGVVTFRDMADVETMLAAAARGGRAVVIGGGLLGLEAATGLLRNGMEVTVLHLMNTLMERQLDAESAALLRADLARRDLRILTDADTAEIVGPDRVTEVRLRDGRTILADLVVMAIGIRPNAALAHDIGLACGRGVSVDDSMRTSDPRIFAVGECVEHRGVTYGLVAPLYEMAKVCAETIAGGAARFAGSVAGARLKVTGVDMFSCGDFNGDAATDRVVFRDPARGVYKRLELRGDTLVGVVLYGDASDGGWYAQLLRDARPLGKLRDAAVFGRAFADPEPA